jgi:hypothetical protein
MLSIAAALLVTAGCGGDDDESTALSDDATPAADADEAETAEADTSAEPADEAATADESEPAPESDAPAAPTGAGSATVTMQGETYRFQQIEPGPDDDYYVFCTVVAGSLQAVLRQVDDGGNTVDGELSVILLEPGGPYEQTGDPAEVQLSLGNRFLRYNEGDPIAAPSSGAAGGGTVTLQETGTFDGETGETATTAVEATIEVSC